MTGITPRLVTTFSLTSTLRRWVPGMRRMGILNVTRVNGKGARNGGRDGSHEEQKCCESEELLHVLKQE